MKATPSTPQLPKNSPLLRWMRLQTRLPAVAILLVSFAFWSPSARAVTGTWVPTAAGTFNWSDTLNWTGAIVPNAALDVANLNLNLAGAQTINLDTGVTLGVLNLGDTTTGFFGQTISGSNTLTFNNGGSGATIAKATAGNTAIDTISANVVLGETLTINNAATAATGAILISGNISDGGGGFGLVKSGLGLVTLSGNNTFTGPVTVSAGNLMAINPASLNSGAANSVTLSGGSLDLRANGDGTQGVENINYGDNVTVTASSTITVDRIPNLPGPTFITPLNKNLQLGTLAIGAQTLTVTPSNGYGLEFTGGVTLTGAATFSVGGTQASNVVSGLTLTGVVDDGAGDFGFTKSGTGTLVLANPGNTFGSASVITVSGGILQGNAEGSFGDPGNSLTLTANSLTQGVRFNYSGVTSRIIRGNAASVGLDVTQGNTITLGTPLDFSAAANNLGKNDAGRLILAAGAPTIAGAAGAWNGAITVGQGALQVSSQNALGTATGATTVSGTGASLEFDNAGTITDAINITNGNQTNKGLSGEGVVRAVSGATTLNGTVALAATLADNQTSSVIVAGVANGATLNLSGATNSVTFNNNGGTNRNFNLAFLAEGTGVGTITTPITNIGTTFNRQTFRVIGGGTWNATAANFFGGTVGGATTAATSIFVTDGTLALSGAGTFGAPAAADLAGRIDVSADGRLLLDESASEANRLNNRQMRLLGGGDLYYIGGTAADTSENIGQQVAFNVELGHSVIDIQAGAGNSATLNTGTVGAVSRTALGTLTVTGDNIGSAAGPGVGVLVGGNAAGGFTFLGQTGATGATNKSIVPWVLVENASLPGGVAFGTADSVVGATTTGTNVIRGLAAAESVAAVPVPTDPVRNVTLGANSNADAAFTFNSLRLDGGADLVLSGKGTALTLDSGGLLVTGSTSVISTGFLTTGGNRDLIVHSLGDTTINAAVMGTTGGLTKTGAGTLTLGAQNAYTGETSIQEGKLVLAGGNDTLFFNNNLHVGPGATVDLNGNNQYVAVLRTHGADFYGHAGAPATVTSTAPATLTLGTSGVSYEGVITGAITLARGQATGSFQDWNVYRELSHTGPTILTGGRTQLLDDGQLTATSRIDIQNATLIINGNGFYSQFDNNRIRDAAPINLTAGMLQYRGTNGFSGTEIMGDLTIGAGMSLLDPAEPGGGVNAAHMQFNSLAQAVGQHGTLRFDGNNNGAIGTTSNVYFATAPTLSNNLIGGWAVQDRDFVTYTATGGVTPLQNAGTAGYNRTNYTDANTNGINSAVAGENIRMIGTGATAAGHSVTLNASRTMNALAYIPQNTAGTASFNLNGNTLTLQSGGLSLSPNVASDTAVSLSVTNGSITAGAPGVGGDLYIHHLPFPGTDSLERRSVNVGATITDNAGGPVALVLNSQNHNGGTARRSTLYLTGDNDFTGGTFVNSGRVVLNTAGVNGTSVVAIPGDLTIIGGVQQNTNAVDGNNTIQLGEVFSFSTGQIANTANVTIKGTGRLDFTGTPAGIPASPNATIAQTIASLTFDNTGGQAPIVQLGAGNLTINGNITAGSTNVGNTAVAVINTSGAGVVDFGGAARTIHVTPVTVNGVAVEELLPSLRINTPLTNATAINKTGNGLLQLAAQNTFVGDFNLQAGGVMLQVSSTPAIVGSAVTSGPLGRGSFNVSGGTFIAGSAATTVANNMNVLGADLNFKGNQNVTINGVTNFATSAPVVDVAEAGMVATLGTSVTGAATSLTKNGLGTLVLAGSNSFSSGVTVNDGTLAGQTGASPSAGSPFGTGPVTYNGGVLSMRSTNGDAVFGNAINVNPALRDVNFDVQGGSQVTMGNLNMPLNGLNNPTVTQVNVTGTAGSMLKFNSTNLDLNGDGGVSPSRVAGQFQTFNIVSGVTTIFNDPFCRNNEPLNIGGGSLLLGGLNCFSNATAITTNGSGAAPLANATTAIYGTGQAVNFTGTNINYTILPQANPVIAGDSANGLQQSAVNINAANLTSGLTWGRGLTSGYNGDMPNDAALDRVPHTNAALSTLGVFNGYLNVTAPGEYKFLLGSDDFSSLVIDGVEVTRDIGVGHGVNDTARGSVFLTTGQHAITYKINTGTGNPGGGGRLLYTGPDTALNGTNGNWQAVDPSRLSYFTGPANSGNNWYNAAQIDNDYNLAAGAVVNIQGLGTDYNSTVKSLTLGNGAALSVTNDLSTLVTPGVGGTGFVGVKGVTTVGTGGIVAPMTGNLYLIGGVSDGGNGLTKVGNGTLHLNNSTAFTGNLAVNDGTVVIRETNALPTTGQTIVAAASTTNFTGFATTNASNIATVTSTAGLYPGQAVTGPNIPAGTTVVSVTDGTTFVMSANATLTATGGTLAHANAASLDLYGVGSSAGRNITINGVGTSSQIGAIYNSQAAAAAVAGNVTLASNSQIAGYGEISLDGAVSSAAGFTLTKAGSGTLTLTGSNTTSLLGPVTVAGGVLNNGALNSGVSGALGANAIVVNAGAVLNLSGNSLAQGLTLNGTSIANTGPNGNTLGNLINSSISSSVAVRNTVTAGSNMMQLPNTAGTATISGNVVLGTATSGIGSNTFAAGGDIIITGIVSGAQTITKVGGDTLTLRGMNTFAGGPTINYGTLKLDNGGVFNGTGGSITVQTGGAFVLDNTGTLTQNRINNNVAANNRNIVLNGGNFTIAGNSAATALNELASASVVAGNNSGILINQGHNTINLTVAGPTAGAITLTATRAGTSADFAPANAGTVLITGSRMGLDAPGTAGSTNIVLTNGATTGVGLIMVGQNSNTALGGAAAATNKGLAAYALVDDGTVVDFATIGTAANGIRAIASGAGNAAERTAAAATLAATANLNSLFNVASTATANTVHSPNSLKLVTGGSLNLVQGSNLNVQSGGILATASATISGPGIIGAEGTNNASATAAAQNLYFWTHGAGTTLTVNAAIGSLQSNTGRTNEIVKAGAGTLVLGGSNFTVTNTRVQEGILRLNNASAIYYRPQTGPSSAALNSSITGPTLQVNAGGTVDMNGFDLPVNNLNSINPAGVQGSLSGGVITNSGANKNLSISTTVSNAWSGVIQGDINFARYGRDTFTVTNSNTYDGPTTIAGGATTLVDLGALRNTSSVTINQAALIWNDNGSQSDPYRLGVTGPAVTFNGGGFAYNGRLGESSTANLGAITLASGSSEIRATAATLGSATIQMASLTRLGNAVANFTGSILGDDGNLRFTAAPALNNGIMGGWAITTSANPYLVTGAGDFVTYDPATGVRAIVDYKTTGGLTYASGNSNQPALGAGAFGAGNNIRVNNNTTMNAGNNVVNSMVLGINATTTLSFTNPTDTLFVQSGGILGTTDANAKNIGGATNPTAANLNGYVTAGNANGSAGAGNAGYELFLHNLGNTLTVNSQIVDNGGNPVTLVTSSGNLNAPAIRFNNSNTYTGATIINGGDIRLNNTFGPAIANSLSIIINGGNESAADTARQAVSRVLLEQNAQLNPGASVTVSSGVANLDLNNFNQTLANITFNNIGGQTGNSNGIGPNVRTGAGTLTLTGGVTATNLSNLGTIPFIAGNVALTSGQHTVLVDPNSNAPQQTGLAINAAMTGAGAGINKTGLGVLALTGVNTYDGPTNVTAGTLVLGGVVQDAATDASMSIGSSRVNVSAGATVDLRGGNALIGSLSGAGTVTNSVYAMINNGSNGNVAALTLGADNTSGADFSGVFTNFINGANETTGFGLNVTKIGTGNQIISGDNGAAIANAAANGDVNNVGTLDIQEGAITVGGANGSLGFTTINVRPGGTLTLDNSTAVKDFRLGGFRLTDSANGDTLNDTTTARAISMQGGTINFNAGSALMNEGGPGALAMGGNKGVGNVTLASGSSTWNFNGGTTNGVSVEVNQLNAGAGSLFLNAGGSQTLGRAIAGAGSINVYVAGGMATQGTGPLQPIGTAVLAPALVAGNIVGGIRADITAADSTGTGFVTYDRFGYRLLTSSEYSAFPVQPDSPLTTGATTNPTNPAAAWAAPNPTVGATYTGNALVTENQSFTTNTSIASLRLDAGGGLVSMGGSIPSAICPTSNFNALGTLNTTTVTGGAVIANVGNTGLTGGAVSAGGAAMRVTVDPTAVLNADTYLISTSTGSAIVKEGAGTLNLNKNVFMGSPTDAGQLVVNGGLVNLNSGANTLTVVNSAGVSLADTLTINPGGTVDMKGFDQTIGSLTSADPLPGGGGTLTNSGALANLYTNSNATFGGTITGAINFYKTGANNLVLTSPSTYTGATTVQGGILLLQDSGTLTSTTYNLNGGQLRFENRAPTLSEVVQRAPASSTLNMRGATFMDLARATDDQVTQTFATVNADQGYSEIRVDSGIAANRTLNIGTLNVTNGAQVNFNTGLGTIGQVGGNVNINWDNFNAGTMTIGTGNAAVIPWAVFSNGNSSEPVMYNPTINPQTGKPVGVVNPNQTVLGYTSTNYGATNFTAALTGQNLNQTSTGTQSEAATVTSRAFNSLRYSTATATTLSLARQELMRIEAGLIISAQTGLTISNGQVTSGLVNNTPTNFYINPVNAGVTMNSRIVDNGTGALTLIKGSANTLTLAPSMAGNVNGTGAAINSTVVGSNVINLTGALATTPAVGTKVYGPGIPNGATVVSVAGSAITISGPALATQNAGSFAFGDALASGVPQAYAGTSAAAASGAAGPTTITVTSAQAATIYPGAILTGTGVPAGVTILTVNTGTGVITTTAWTASAAVAANQSFTYTSGTNVAAASGAAIPTTFTVPNSIASTLFIGSTIAGTGIPAGVSVTAIGAADSGGTGLTTVTNSGGTASAAIGANQGFSYGSAQVSANSAYSGPTIVNSGTLALGGAVGSRSLGGGSLTVNNTGAVTMTNAGQIAPSTDVVINAGGSVTFAPVTVTEPASGQINAINSLTFNNNGGTATPTLAGGTNGIVTVKNGLITATGDNQGSAALVSGVLNFGQVSLGSWGSGATTVSVSDVHGFVAGQTVTGTGIAPGTTILGISGNTITLSAATTGASAATGSLLAAVNHASNSTGAISPTLNVISTDTDELTADLVVSAVITNSPSWTNLAGGGAALQKTGNGNLVLSGQSTFNNGVNLTAGALTIGANSTPTTGAVTSGPLGTGTLTISGGTTIQSDSTARTVANNVVVAGDFTFGGQQSGNSLTINGTVDLGSSVRNITVTNPTVTGTLGGVVSGTGGLTKSGNGILTLNGANTYTGTTTINAGLVNAGNATALGASTNDLVVKCNAALNVNGQSLSVDGLNGDDATHGGLITNSGAAATLTIGSNGEASATFAGTITNAANALSVTKTGAGTQILTGLNTYTGTTAVNAGVLQVGTNATGTGSTLGSGAVTVSGTGKLAGTGHVLAPTAGSTMTIDSGGTLAPGDSAGASTGNLTLGSVPGSGLQPMPVTTAAVSPSSVNGVVNLAVNTGGQLELGISTPTLVSQDVINLLAAPGGGLNGTSYTDALTTFAGLSVTEQQKWEGQAWTQQAVGLVGSNTLTYTGLANAIGLGNVSGNGGLYVGQTVSGAGIAGGTTITAITTGANPVITLSNAITASSTAITVNGTSVQNVNVIEGLNSITLADATGLAIGQTVSGYGIPANAVIASLTGNVITLKDSVTNGALAPLATTYAPTASFGAPGSYDHLTITGTLVLGTGTSGGVVEVIDNGFLSSPASGAVFNLLDWATLTSGWTVANLGTNFRAGGNGGGDLELPTLTGGLLWDVSAFADRGILVVVPEPSRALLLLIGLLGMVSRRRRRA